MKYFYYEDSDRLVPVHRMGSAISFLNGVVFKSDAGYYIVKLFFNGSISICVDMVEYLSRYEEGGIACRLLDPNNLY
jgi:hypothetical protein